MAPWFSLKSHSQRRGAAGTLTGRATGGRVDAQRARAAAAADGSSATGGDMTDDASDSCSATSSTFTSRELGESFSKSRAESATSSLDSSLTGGLSSLSQMGRGGLNDRLPNMKGGGRIDLMKMRMKYMKKTGAEGPGPAAGAGGMEAEVAEEGLTSKYAKQAEVRQLHGFAQTLVV